MERRRLMDIVMEGMHRVGVRDRVRWRQICTQSDHNGNVYTGFL